MGGAPSNVHNNDELVEYLLQNCYVHRKKVEIVFRTVDRADYVLSSHQESAYNDLAWKHGNLHLSAPCVYGVAMEYLSLKPGQSFLNIGSGTGYFSTMAGLLLGPYGINHGIELHEDCIQYARERLENFKQNSLALQEFEFCEPTFVQGNCLRVVPAREYDTVYCGAAVSENNIAAVKRFVRIGGSIVMPYKGRLCCFRRTTETDWVCKKSLGVSFATLVTPDPSDQNSIALPDSNPLSLQELCRSKVRQILRRNVWIEHPELEKRNLSLPDRQPRTDPFCDQSDKGVSEDDDDEDEDEDDDEDDDDEENDDDVDEEADGHIIHRTRLLFNMEVDSNDTTYSHPVGLRRVAMFVQQRISPEQQREEASLDRIPEEGRNDDLPTAAGSSGSLEQDGSSGTAVNESMDVSPNLALNLSLNEPQASQVSPNRSGRVRIRGRPTNDKSTRISDSASGRECECDSDDELLTQWRKIAKRENTDSGIVDDVNITNDDTSSSSNVNQSDSDHTSSSSNVNRSDSDDEDDMDIDFSSVALRETFRQVCSSHSKDLSRSPSTSEDCDFVESRLFITYMQEKIVHLPLPNKLKRYINHSRNL